MRISLLASDQEALRAQGVVPGGLQEVISERFAHFPTCRRISSAGPEFRL